MPENFEVVDCKGIENLTDQIPVRLKESGLQTLGIMVDADTDIKSRWNSLKNKLSQSGFEIPDDIPQNGLIINNGRQKVGVWIMPDNRISGMLEDFIAFLVPADDSLLPIANETLNSLEERNLHMYKTSHRSKALIHTWLAWQEDPGTPLGLSITKKYVQTDIEVCRCFIDWIKNLFG